MSLPAWLQTWVPPLRQILTDVLPQWMGRHIETAPDWAVLAAAPVGLAILGGSLWAALKALNMARMRVFEPGKAKRAEPATTGQVQDAERRAAEAEARARDAEAQARRAAEAAEQTNAKLDLVLAALAAARDPKAGPLDAEAQKAKAEAVTAIQASGDAAQKKALALIAEGKVQEGFALLEADAKAHAEQVRASAAEAAAKWRELGALANGVDTARALAAYEEADRLAPGDFWPLVYLARLYDEAGRLQDALAAARRAGAAAKTDREQGVAGSELGDRLMKAGDLAGARVAYGAHNQAAERLAAANPTSALAQRDVSVSLEKLGDVAVQTGDLAAAKARFEASLAIDERLADANPTSAEAQRNVSVSLNKLGEVAVEAGDLAAAKARFEASLATRERLAAANPTSALAQRDLIVSYAKLAGVFPKQGWWAKAHDAAKRLQAEGRLAPADGWMVEDTRKQAEADR